MIPSLETSVFVLTLAIGLNTAFNCLSWILNYKNQETTNNRFVDNLPALIPVLLESTNKIAKEMSGRKDVKDMDEMEKSLYLITKQNMLTRAEIEKAVLLNQLANLKK